MSICSLIQKIRNACLYEKIKHQVYFNGCLQNGKNIIIYKNPELKLIKTQMNKISIGFLMIDEDLFVWDYTKASMEEITSFLFPQETVHIYGIFKNPPIICKKDFTEKEINKFNEIFNQIF